MGIMKSVRGADVQIFVNGAPLNVAVAVRWQADPGRHAIYGIDQYTPFELAPGQAVIKGTLDIVRQHLDGGVEGRGVAAPERLLLLEKYFSLAVIDRLTDSVLLVIDNASVEGQQWAVSAKGDLTGSFSFVGLGWSNEAEN